VKQAATHISSVLEYDRISDDLIYFKDGGIAAIWEIEGKDSSLCDASQRNGDAQRLRTLINALPTGWRFQIHGTVQSDTGMPALESSPEASPLLAQMESDRRLRFERLAQSKDLKRVKLYFAARSPSKKSKNLLSILGLGSAKRPNGADPVDLQKMEETGRNITEASLKPVRVRSDGLTRLIFERWNPGRSMDGVRLPANGSVQSLMQSDLVIDPKTVSIGNYISRVMSLRSLSERTYPCLAQSLDGLPAGAEFNFCFEIEDSIAARERLERDRRIAFSMSSSPHRPRDIDSESKLEELDALLELLTQGFERIIKCSFAVFVSTDQSSVLPRLESDAASAIRGMGGSEVLYESLAAREIFLKSHFPNARTNDREHVVTSSNLCDLLPIYWPSLGQVRAPVQLRNRIGGRFGFDPFSSAYSNYNQVVSGGSGAGKSFATNLLIFQLLSKGCSGYIIDIGGSYQNLCELLGGQYVSLRLDSGLTINPFDLASKESTPTPGKIRFLISMLEAMVMDQDGPRLGKLAQSEIEEALKNLYEQTQNPSLSELAKLLTDSPSADLRQIGRTLQLWTRPKAFGQLFDGPSNVRLNSPMVCFDLKGLEAHPDLQRVALVIISDLVWRGIQADRHSKKIVVFDECWKLISDGAGAQFIGEIFRTCRKYHTSTIAISQALGDFYKSKIAEAILPNAEIKWLLRQKGFNAAEIKEIIELNDVELTTIQNLRSRKGHFSEALLVTGVDRQVVRIESTPLEYWLATTAPADLSHLNRQGFAQADTQTKISIINAAAKEHPHGIQENQK
jgi:type IV secretory pathway VirB4 component